MSREITIGPYSAYAIAVKYGYTGTEQQWIAEQEASRLAAAQSAADASAAATRAENAQQAAEAAKGDALDAIGSAKTAAVTAVTDTKNTATKAVQTAQDTATKAVSATQSAATAAVEKKGEEVLATIPEDYTALSESVGQLKEDILNRFQEIIVGKRDIKNDLLFTKYRFTSSEDYYLRTDLLTFPSNTIFSFESKEKNMICVVLKAEKQNTDIFESLNLQSSGTIKIEAGYLYRIQVYKINADAELSDVQYFDVSLIVDLYNSNEILKNNIESEIKKSKIEIISPKNVHAVVGKNVNICLDNLLLNGLYDLIPRFYYEGKPQTQDGEAVIDVTEKEITGNLCLYKDASLDITEQKKLSINPVAVNSGTGRTLNVMIIGESTTDNAYVLKALTELFVSDDMKIKLLGTRERDGYKCEGRGGWTTRNYLNDSEYNGATNAFYNPSSKTFDFPYYITQHPENNPNIVIINMGINDTQKYIPATETIENINKMIDSIRKVNYFIRVIVAQPNLPSALSCWEVNGNIKTKMLNLIKLMLAEFEPKESTGLYFTSPVYMYVNSKWDMRYAEKPLNQYNEKKFYVAYPDGTHPSEIGYKKMALCYYNTLKYVASKY